MCLVGCRERLCNREYVCYPDGNLHSRAHESNTHTRHRGGVRGGVNMKTCELHVAGLLGTGSFKRERAPVCDEEVEADLEDEDDAIVRALRHRMLQVACGT